MSIPRLSKDTSSQFDLLIIPAKRGFAFSLSFSGNQTAYEELLYDSDDAIKSLEDAKRDFVWLNWPYKEIIMLLPSISYSLVPDDLFESDWSKAWQELGFGAEKAELPLSFHLSDENAYCLSSYSNEEVLRFKAVFQGAKFAPLALSLYGWAEAGSDIAVVLPSSGGFHLAVFEAGLPAMLRHYPAYSAENAIAQLTSAIQAATLAPLTTTLHILPAPFFNGFTQMAHSRFKTVIASAINPMESTLEKVLASKFSEKFLR